MTVFRPWGPINWLFGRLAGRNWSLLACSGTEERSIALALQVGRQQLSYAEILAIRDPEPLDKEALTARLHQRRQQLQQEGGFATGEIREVELLASIEEIQGPVSRIANAGCRNLLIDITSFPKMWFFPIIQAALAEERFDDIVVTYTSAAGYSDQLSENASPMRVLPGFFAEDGRSSHDSIIVGIGFEPLGLPSLLSDQSSKKIRLIFPFPPGPPGHRKNWMFVRQIEQLTSIQQEKMDLPERVHIHMYDCPQIFDALCEMTNNGHQTSAVAPYGPKTVSLAMCLFSLAAAAAGRSRVPAYYAQPLRYALDYTWGVGKRGGVTDISGYCLRLSGRNLYSIA